MRKNRASQQWLLSSRSNTGMQYSASFSSDQESTWRMTHPYKVVPSVLGEQAVYWHPDRGLYKPGTVLFSFPLFQDSSYIFVYYWFLNWYQYGMWTDCIPRTFWNLVHLFYCPEHRSTNLNFEVNWGADHFELCNFYISL